MSFFDGSAFGSSALLIISFLLGSVVGSLLDVFTFHIYIKHREPDEIKRQNSMITGVKNELISWFKTQEEEAAKQPTMDVKIDSGPILAQITEVIDKKLESLKMSELGKISGMVRGTQAAQIALASEANPKLMGILTGLGLSKKESAAIMMALSESGGVQGLPQGLNGGQQRSNLPGI